MTPGEFRAAGRVAVEWVPRYMEEADGGFYLPQYQALVELLEADPAGASAGALCG